MPRRSSTTTTSSSSYYETPGHYVSLTTTGQPTASTSAKMGTLTPQAGAASSGNWANTEGLGSTQAAEKADSSGTAASGWDSLSNDVHIVIYVLAAVAGVCILAGGYFCFRRRKRRQQERRFNTRTAALRESFISSPTQLQAEKEKQGMPMTREANDPVELSNYPASYQPNGNFAAQQAHHQNQADYNGDGHDALDYYTQSSAEHYGQAREVDAANSVYGNGQGYMQQSALPLRSDSRLHHQQEQFSWEQPYSPPARQY